MEQPLVTVFIPMYNCEQYISQSLESIINQTYSNLEILIIDDGSTDKTMEIVNSYRDNRIRLIKNKENKGIPYTRNLALLESTGIYMAIMDADDIALPNRIEKQVEFMEENKDIDALGSLFETFSESTNIKRKFKKIIGKVKMNQPKSMASEEIKAGLIFSNRIGNPTALIRLETIKKYNLSYNLDYFVAQDYDMWVQLSKVGRLFILPEVLLKYRFGHSNITKKSKVNKLLKRKRIIDSIHKDILNYYKFELTEEEIKVFNEFFGDDDSQSKINDSTLDNLPKLLAKILKQNRDNRLFNEQLFIKVIRDTVFDILSNRKIGLIKKYYLYIKVCKTSNIRSNIKEMIFLATKHVYKLFFSKN